MHLDGVFHTNGAYRYRVRVHLHRPADPSTRRPTQTLSCRYALLVCLGLALGCAGGGERPAGRPNILLLVIDCLRADHVSSYGYERLTTPNLDALAADGVSFDRVYAQGNWTRTSVPSYLTGLYPTEHGLTEFDNRGRGVVSEALASEILTMAEAVAAAGYRTAMVGRQPQLAPRFGLHQGFEYYDHEAPTEEIQSRFLRWLEKTPDRPFFAYLHYLDIHWPYCPPDSTRGMFGSGRSGVDFCGRWRRLRRQILSGDIAVSPDTLSDMVARYNEELHALDARIGRLVEALRSRRMWEDTLVIVTSDHGEEFLEHGNIVHGHTLHDVLLHVPLIVRLPGDWRVERGARSAALTELRNLPATIADMARSEHRQQVRGTSLVPWILGQPPRQHVDRLVFAEDEDAITVRSHRYRLIANRALTEVSFYRIDAETRAAREVAGSHHRERERMTAALQEWLRRLQEAPDGTDQILDEKTRSELEALGYLGG